jgi:hypothetical protein
MIILDIEYHVDPFDLIYSGEHTEDDEVFKCHVSPDGGESFYTHSVSLNVLG